MSMHKLDILILCNRPTRNSQAPMVFDHLNAFHECSKHNIFELSTIHAIPSRMDLAKFDVLVIHYTLGMGFEHYINTTTKQAISDASALKVVFIQDEYRYVNRVTRVLRDIGADIVFSCVPEDVITKVYVPEKLPNLTVINNLSGYVPEVNKTFRSSRIQDRPIDVGYRARKPPYWLGSLGVEKWTIADEFIKYSAGRDLVLDLSYNESDRIYGVHWNRFLSSCKDVLGVESGSSIVDLTGEIEKNVDTYMMQNPQASFKDVYDKFLKSEEGKVNINQMSPRIFEAAATKTLMVLYEGEYSGIIQPWKHYVPLKKDFSNFNQVIKVLKDPDQMESITNAAYEELIASEKYSYKKFISKFDTVVANEFKARAHTKQSNGYTKFRYNFDLYTSGSYLVKHIVSSVLQSLLLGVPAIRKLMFDLWFSLPMGVQKKLRPYVRVMNK